MTAGEPDAVDVSPTAAGFRMPAEWESQAAIWLSWPHRRQTWPGHFRPIPAKFAEIIARISQFENVRVNIAPPLQRRAMALLNRAKADLARVELYDHATNDCWCRDHGPIFLKNDRTGEVALTDWKFNSWGGKYRPYDLDDRVPAEISRALTMRRYPIDMVLEGGSIDVNGGGCLLTTESCLLHRNRNPHLVREEIAQRLKSHLGVTDVIWLGRGIAGDDTDGHVDDLSRFFGPDGIVTAVEHNPHDVNYAPLQENMERLQALRTAGGRRLSVVELPMPQPCYCDGHRMPASYANFLVLNGAVLMPAFQQPARDAEAAAVLAGCFPGRQIVPIDCLDLVWGLGTIHCITQQQPACCRPGRIVFDPRRQ